MKAAAAARVPAASRVPTAAASTDLLAPLRSAGITGPCMAFVSDPTARDATHHSDEPPEPHTLERAVQTLETVLTQPRQIQ